MTIYRVGARPYRGHRPGEEFEAMLEPAAERRALERGAISIVRKGKPALQPDSYRLPTESSSPAARRSRQTTKAEETTEDESASDSDQ